jgi:hypothetical protein
MSVDRTKKATPLKDELSEKDLDKVAGGDKNATKDNTRPTESLSLNFTKIVFKD